MLSIVWNNKWLYWQLMVAHTFFFLPRERYSDLLKTALSHAEIRLISRFVLRASWDLCVRVCVWCVSVCSLHVNVSGSEMTGGFAALLVLNVRWSQWMSTTPQCVRLLQLKERESSHQIIPQPHSVTLTCTRMHAHARTHTYLHTVTLVLVH